MVALHFLTVSANVAVRLESSNNADPERNLEQNNRTEGIQNDRISHIICRHLLLLLKSIKRRNLWNQRGIEKKKSNKILFVASTLGGEETALDLIKNSVIYFCESNLPLLQKLINLKSSREYENSRRKVPLSIHELNTIVKETYHFRVLNTKTEVTCLTLADQGQRSPLE